MKKILVILLIAGVLATMPVLANADDAEVCGVPLPPVGTEEEETERTGPSYRPGEPVDYASEPGYAPQTFDAGVIAGAAAVASAVGYAITKKSCHGE